MRPPAFGEAGGKQAEADERHRDQHHAPRSTRLRDSLRGSRCSSRRAEPLRTWCRLGRRRVTERVRWSRLRGGPLARDGASRAPHGRLSTPTHDGHATELLVRRRARRGSKRRGYRPLHGAVPGVFRRPAARVLGSNPRRARLRGRRSGLRRRRGRRRLRDRRSCRRLARWKKRERVEVPVRVGREPDAEIHVRLGAFDVAGRPDRPDDVALGDLCARRHRDRSEMDERDRVAVRGAYGEAKALVRQLSDERHDPVHRGVHVRPGRSADVDAAVLAAAVRIPTDERPQHRSVDGPRPRRRARRQDEEREQSQHDAVACSENHAARVQGRSAVVKSGYSDRR